MKSVASSHSMNSSSSSFLRGDSPREPPLTLAQHVIPATTPRFTPPPLAPLALLPHVVTLIPTSLCISAAYSAASAPVRMSGADTTSTRGTPARFRSTWEAQRRGKGRGGSGNK